MTKNEVFIAGRNTKLFEFNLNIIIYPEGNCISK